MYSLCENSEVHFGSVDGSWLAHYCFRKGEVKVHSHHVASLLHCTLSVFVVLLHRIVAIFKKMSLTLSAPSFSSDYGVMNFRNTYIFVTSHLMIKNAEEICNPFWHNMENMHFEQIFSKICGHPIISYFCDPLFFMNKFCDPSPSYSLSPYYKENDSLLNLNIHEPKFTLTWNAV